jgi:hypothetical protein
VLLRELIAGGGPLRIRADRASAMLRRVRPDTAVAAERKRLAHDLLADIRRLDLDIAAIKIRIAQAVTASTLRRQPRSGRSCDPPPESASANRVEAGTPGRVAQR